MSEPPTLSAARERAIAVLQDAVARDQLELEDFEQRMDLVMAAKDHASIRIIVEEVRPNTALAVIPPTGLAAEPVVTTAIFGGSSRTPHGVLPRELKARAVFGGVELDLREATFQPGVTTVRCMAVFGGIEIAVPPHVRLEVGGQGIFGGFEEGRRKRGLEEPDDTCVLRVVGKAIFGGVSAGRKASKK